MPSSDSPPPPDAPDAQLLCYAEELARPQGARSLADCLRRAEGARWKVRLVDHEPSTRLLESTTLGTQGYDIRQAGTGGEALLEAPRDRPDLIVLDLHLPDMNGYRLCATLKADMTLCDNPVVLLTGERGPGTEEAAPAVGAAAFLT